MNTRNSLLYLIILAAVSVVLPRVALADDTGAASMSAKGMNHLMLAAASGSVTIISPTDGATVGGNVELKYNVTLSPTGNHLHVYVDRRRPIIDHDVSGCPCTLKLPMLGPGKHRVAVKEATRHHHLTGVGATVTFNVK